MAPQVFAASYKLLVLPDNIVTESIALDSYIYDASAEFFADEIVTLINTTDKIKASAVSETRAILKKDPSTMLCTKNLMARFKTSYNIDYAAVKKLANKTGSRYVLLLTSYVDSENYILRRTVWDFLNIAGATVVDPAYKISTYAVLIDTKTNAKTWSNTYYKTISTCENRIMTRGQSPQTEQLQKIKDYSRYLCPQIAQAVQQNTLTAEELATESKKIDYDISNIDNVFTKKYRHIGKEMHKEYDIKKARMNARKETWKQKSAERKQRAEEKRLKKLQEQEEKGWIEPDAQLNVKATPITDKVNDAKESLSPTTNKVKNTTTNEIKSLKETILKPATTEKTVKENPIKEINYTQDYLYDIQRTKTNTLRDDYNSKRPSLRDYYN